MTSTTVRFTNHNNSDNNNNTDNSNQTIKCLQNLLGDGNCDEQNNNDSCNFDDGDCCAASCEKSCASKVKTLNACKYKCGSNNYACKNTDQCSKCLNGVCKNINQCMSLDTSKQSILSAVPLYLLSVD